MLLCGERDFAPFDEARVVMALQRLQSARQGSQKLEEALRNLMRLYDRREARGSPARLPRRALRLYAVRWVLRPGFEGPPAPQERILVAQAIRDDAEAGRRSSKAGVATASLRKLPNTWRWCGWPVTGCSSSSICRSTTVAAYVGHRIGLALQAC